MNPAMMSGIMGAGKASFDTSSGQKMMMALAEALRQGGLGQMQQQQQAPMVQGQVTPVDTSQGIGKFANAMSALTMGPVKLGNQTVDYRTSNQG